MKLNPIKFNGHLKHMGQQLLWRRSYACACVNPDSGAPDPKHALCNGKGRFWDDGIETVAGIAHQDANADWQAAGMWMAGDMLMSVPENSPMWSIGQFDRVLMLNATDVFSQPLKRGAINERLLFTAASFRRVFWLDPVTRLPVDGALPVVDAAGHLSWPNGGAPQVGQVYSLTGTKYDEYYCFSAMPSDRGEHSGARLPKKVPLRLFDLFGR